MLKSSIAVLVGFMALTANAFAQTETYAIDNDHTHIVWLVDRFGFTATIGTFTDISGMLELDEANPENSSVIAEIALSGLRSDLQQREDIVRGEWWLNAAVNPVIRFESTSVDLLYGEDGAQAARISGTLSLAGMSAPASFVAELNRIAPDPVSGRRAAGFSAMGSFSRSDFEINTALGLVGDTVTFQIELLALREEVEQEDSE